MSFWLKAAKIFEEDSKKGDYFEAHDGLYALRRIQAFLETSFPQIFFLLGEPGSGKSFTLNHLQRLYSLKRLTVLIENPFLTPEQLLKRLLLCLGIKEEISDLEELRIKATNCYKEIDHLIMIDEGQLMSADMREFIRILSDSKVFYFVIAMHKEDGEVLLNSPHFNSRPHQVVCLESLKLDEYRAYLKKELKNIKEISVDELFSEKFIKKSWEYSKGNFRSFKRCYHNLFILLDHAHKKGKKEHFKPNFTLLKMAAMKSGLIATMNRNGDFDSLEKEIKQDKPILLTVVLTIFLVGSFFYIFKIQKTKKTETLAYVKNEKLVENKLDKNQVLLEEQATNSYATQEAAKELEDLEKVEVEQMEEVTKDSSAKKSEDEIVDEVAIVQVEINEEIKEFNVNSIQGALLLKTPPLPLPNRPVEEIYIKY